QHEGNEERTSYQAAPVSGPKCGTGRLILRRGYRGYVAHGGSFPTIRPLARRLSTQAWPILAPSTQSSQHKHFHVRDHSDGCGGRRTFAILLDIVCRFRYKHYHCPTPVVGDGARYGGILHDPLTPVQGSLRRPN